MIQRIQSVWLLLSAVAAFLTLKLSFFSGNTVAADQTKAFQHFSATSSLVILILTAVLGATAFIAIFLYKNRKLQLRITFSALLISIINIVLYYYQAQKFVAAERSYSITAMAAVVIPVFLLLAIRGIYKDHKLVKSLDRLR